MRSHQYYAGKTLDINDNRTIEHQILQENKQI